MVANAVNVFSSLFRGYKGDFHEVLKYKDSVCSCYTNNSWMLIEFIAKGDAV